MTNSRQIIRLLVAVAVVAAAGCASTSSRVAKVETQASQAAMTPQLALERLIEGNERFVSGRTLNRDLGAQVRATAGGQYPFASVISCLDSRTSTELIFDQGIGDVFNGRIAGNFINEHLLGSLEFASKVVGARLIVVVGHTQCGAVMGACDNVQLGHVTSVVQQIRPAVEAVRDVPGERSSRNHAFVDRVARANVELTVAAILARSDILREMAEKGEIGVIGAMYDLVTGRVEFFPPATPNLMLVGR
ncbi:MAG TPA: carbonic anhydrase family protein [Verrucomicrobiota bacterium]|nr:carbonic anhydrase family protein [Verrucomicrobiota bacterium]